MDVIIAARLSKKNQGHRQTGIESQDEDAREWAEAQGHNVIETVADHASGTKPMWKRTHLAPWVTQPDLMNRYQGIVAAKQDRLSRADFTDEVALRQWAEQNNKTLFIVDRELRWPPRQGPHYDDDVEAWNSGATAAHREWAATSARYRRMHKRHRDSNELTGRPPYGYRVAGIECGQSPCRCWENGKEDGKTLVIFEPEARVIREAKDRYLTGESTHAIVDDFNRRGIPSPMWKGQPGTHWRDTTLGKILRNPATAGRRMDQFDTALRDESKRKTILTFPGIITWAEHEQICSLLDSRAYRRGISPYNVTLLTSVIFDSAGHPLIRTRSRGRDDQYLCRKGCGVSVSMTRADYTAGKAVLDTYGDEPHKVRQVIPGKNHYEEIARLRQSRNELDDLADDYAERHAAITAEIRRLAREDRDNPQPDEIAWVPSGKTIARWWESLDTPGRRDWLREQGFRFTVEASGDGWDISYDASATVAGTDMGNVRVVRHIPREIPNDIP